MQSAAFQMLESSGCCGTLGLWIHGARVTYGDLAGTMVTEVGDDQWENSLQGRDQIAMMVMKVDDDRW